MLPTWASGGVFAVRFQDQSRLSPLSLDISQCFRWFDGLRFQAFNIGSRSSRAGKFPHGERADVLIITLYHNAMIQLIAWSQWVSVIDLITAKFAPLAETMPPTYRLVVGFCASISLAWVRHTMMQRDPRIVQTDTDEQHLALVPLPKQVASTRPCLVRTRRVSLLGHSYS